MENVNAEFWKDKGGHIPVRDRIKKMSALGQIGKDQPNFEDKIKKFNPEEWQRIRDEITKFYNEATKSGEGLNLKEQKIWEEYRNLLEGQKVMTRELIKLYKSYSEMLEQENFRGEEELMKRIETLEEDLFINKDRLQELEIDIYESIVGRKIERSSDPEKN